MSKGEMEHLDADNRAAYLDRALDPSARATATAHLAECAECRALVAAQIRASDGLTGTGHGARMSWGSPTGWLIAAAVAVLFLGLAVIVRQEREPPATTVVEGPEPRREAAPAAPPSAPSPEVLPPAAAPPPGPPAGRAMPAAEVEPELLALRGATKRAGGKTFRFKEGAWVDTLYEPEVPVPPAPLERGSEAYRATLRAHPLLARYADVGPVVIVVLDTLAYRIFTTP